MVKSLVLVSARKMNRPEERSLKGNKGSETGGGNPRKSRKTKKDREAANKARFEAAIIKLTKENKERKKKAKHLRAKREPIGETWGDQITSDPEWPGITKEKTLTITISSSLTILLQDNYIVNFVSMS